MLRRVRTSALRSITKMRITCESSKNEAARADLPNREVNRPGTQTKPPGNGRLFCFPRTHSERAGRIARRLTQATDPLGNKPQVPDIGAHGRTSREIRR